MKTMTRPKPIRTAVSPRATESAPRDAVTVRCSTGVSRAGRAPRVEHVGQIGCGLDGEAAFNDPRTAGDGAPDHRGGYDGVIQHNREATAAVLGRCVRERAGACGVEAKADGRLTVLIKGLTGIDQLITRDQRPTLHGEIGLARAFGRQDHYARRGAARYRPDSLTRLLPPCERSGAPWCRPDR